MAIVDYELSGDNSQDEARLNRAFPVISGMSIPLNPFYQSNEVPSQEETQQEGRWLLTAMVSQELQRNRIVFDEEEDPTELIYEHLSGPEPEEIPAQDQLIANHPLFRQAGRELLTMADEFARSREREQLRRRAQSLDVSLINRENIFSILEELFHGGVTRERLVILFVFCSDLIISVLRNSPTSGIRWEILSWLWQFFCDRVCAWVQRHGGWERVLCFYLPKAVFVTTGVAITAGIAFYIWKNW